MYISQLFEAEDPSRVLVIYPGRFQPWHKGHKAVYEHLIRLFGRDNVFIATSNKVDPPRSPFSFGEKIQFMQLTGVSMDRVVETRDPYRALEIVQSYDPKTTRLIFAVSEKDMAEDPRFKFGYKKDGSPTYLQAMPNNPSEMQAFERHGYVMTVPTFQFTVLGEPMRSATEVRAQFAEADDATQRNIIKDLFGRYSPEIHSLMKHKITLNENYEYMPPGAGAGQTRRVMNKISAKDNKFIWKKPNQIGGSFTDQQLSAQGFKKSQYNSWGGTQDMWNRLMTKESTLNQPTPTAQDILQKHQISPEELIAQLKLGVKIEFEHTKDAKVAYEIALDHLNERPDYYTVLARTGLEESSLNEFAPSGNSASSYYAVTANFVNEFAQQKQEELQDLIDSGWTKQDLAQAGIQQGHESDIAHFEQVRDSFLKGLKPGFDAYLQGDTQLKDQLGAYWIDNDLPLNQDWEKIYGEPWGRDEYNEDVAEVLGQTKNNPKIDLTPNYPNYSELTGEFVGINKKQKAVFKILSAKLKPGQGTTDKISQSLATGKLVAIEISRVKNRITVGEDAAGVGVIAQNKKMARDPRYSMSMTKDVRPGQDKKNLKAWRLIK